MRQWTRPRAAALADRMAGAWHRRRAGGRSTPPDALYRQAVREDETRADLRQRTEPERIARELSADARRRGL